MNIMSVTGQEHHAKHPKRKERKQNSSTDHCYPKDSPPPTLQSDIWPKRQFISLQSVDVPLASDLTKPQPNNNPSKSERALSDHLIQSLSSVYPLGWPPLPITLMQLWWSRVFDSFITILYSQLDRNTLACCPYSFIRIDLVTFLLLTENSIVIIFFYIPVCPWMEPRLHPFKKPSSSQNPHSTSLWCFIRHLLIIIISPSKRSSAHHSKQGITMV